jgi:hypothetical protein
MDFKITNLILKTKINNLSYSNFLKFLLLENYEIEKNSIYKKIKYSTQSYAVLRIFKNGVVTITGISFNSNDKEIIHHKLDEIKHFLKNIIINDLNSINTEQIYKKPKANSLILIREVNSNTTNLIGYCIYDKNEVYINGTLYELSSLTDLYLYIQKTKLKKKQAFTCYKNYENGFLNLSIINKFKISFDLFNSKYFYNNNTISFNFDKKNIYSNNIIIGKINLIPEKTNDALTSINSFIDSSGMNIISINVYYKFLLNEKIDFLKTAHKLINKNIICEYKKYFNVYINNLKINISFNGSVNIKGITNKTNLNDINNTISFLKNEIILTT